MKLSEVFENLVAETVGKSWLTVENASLLRIDNDIEKLGLINVDNLSIQVYLQPDVQSEPPGEATLSARSRGEDRTLESASGGEDSATSAAPAPFSVRKKYLFDRTVDPPVPFRLNGHHLIFLLGNAPRSIPAFNGVLPCSVAVRKKRLEVGPGTEWTGPDAVAVRDADDALTLTINAQNNERGREHELSFRALPLGEAFAVGNDEAVFSALVFGAVYLVTYSRAAPGSDLRAYERYILGCMKRRNSTKA